MNKLAIRSSLALLAIVLVVVGCAPPEVTSAKLYIRNKDWASARTALEKALDLYPDNAEAHKLMGSVEQSARNWEAMRVHYERAISLGGQQMKKEVQGVLESLWVQNYNSGLSMLNRGDMERAESLFLVATQIAPERTPAWVNLGFIYGQTDRADEALVMYNRVLELDPQNLSVQKNLGFMHFNRQEYDKAIGYLKPLADADISDGAVVSALGVCYIQSGQKQLALDLYERALEADEYNGEVLFNLAYLYIQEGNDEKALPHLKKVIEVNPFDSESMSQIGFILMNQEKMGEAFPYLLKASELDPNNHIVWRFLGIYYIQNGMIEEGTAAMNRADQLEALLGGDPPPAR